jgi:hypothetical protein
MTSLSKSPRTLIFSMRNVFGNDLYRCPHYEFEDIISQIDDAEIVAPQGNPASRRNHLANLLAYHAPIPLKARLHKIRPSKHYELFFAICGSPRDLLVIDAISHLLDACTTKICLMDELWIKQMTNHRHFIDVLKNFDLVALYYSQTVKPLSEYIQRKCIFVPPGVDSIRFCPFPSNPVRAVDIYSVGRRSPITHQELVRLVNERGLFYLYDSIAGLQAIDPKEHRDLFANTAKRSKYFIVNPGLVDRTDRRGSQIEIGNRYFEGAAAGAIMIGEAPANDKFQRLFDWQDAVIPLPYNSDKIGAVMAELDKQPERQERIRQTNVTQVLTRHDWAYRWEAILGAVGLEAMPKLLHRKESLVRLAEQVQVLS